jgi:hypothetical protein
MGKREVAIYATIFLLMLVSVGLIASPSFSNWFHEMTGFLSSQPTNVSIAISGTNPVIVAVFNATLTGANVDPTEYNQTSIEFTVTVSDPDGVSDINDSSVLAILNNSGVTRTNSTTCSKVAGAANTTSQNYTCSVGLWYFDDNSTWSINVSAVDYGNLSFQSNSSKVFSFNPLKAVQMTPPLITWSALTPLGTNKTSNQNTTLNNTGNVIINNGNVKINAINMQGVTTNTAYFNVSSITASWVNTLGACLNMSAGNATTLFNATDTAIVGANLTRGNLSLNTGIGQEQFYYCVPTVPTIPSQSYATNNSGGWYVKIF